MLTEKKRNYHTLELHDSRGRIDSYSLLGLLKIVSVADYMPLALKAQSKLLSAHSKLTQTDKRESHFDCI